MGLNTKLKFCKLLYVEYLYNLYGAMQTVALLANERELLNKCWEYIKMNLCILRKSLHKQFLDNLHDCF